MCRRSRNGEGALDVISLDRQMFRYILVVRFNLSSHLETNRLTVVEIALVETEKQPL